MSSRSPRLSLRKDTGTDPHEPGAPGSEDPGTPVHDEAGTGASHWSGRGAPTGPAADAPATLAPVDPVLGSPVERASDDTDVRVGLSGPPFRRVLVANRGEIALRIIRACRELGVSPAAVYSDADVDARHVRAADIAVRIGPARAADSYLRADRIIEAALAVGAQAVHPGYGFLSEQAPFAIACAGAGLVFVGPEPRTLAALGDKLAARRAAREAGVPIAAGTFESVAPEDLVEGPRTAGRGRRGAAARRRIRESLAEVAASIGYPLLVKASAGGGGRGMRLVQREAELPEAIAAAAREAQAAFGDGSVYLEHYVEGARHIEVQLLGDAHGTIVALGERDCSTQRRHQKLVEEAPAPGLSVERRRELHALAVTVARTVGLRNAATAEFLLSPDGRLFFLEVNARLQVEHGVSELVSGIDLVHEQLWIAAGRPLPENVLLAAVQVLEPRRHAIEVRISAEDPALDFAPIPGRLTRWREPGGPGVRIDSGVEEGAVISDSYDPLLAKLQVVGPDRASALARLRRALAEFEVGGIQTTLPFHRWLAEHPPFVEGNLRTDLVERDWRPEPLRAAAAARAAAAVAESPLQRRASQPALGQGSRGSGLRWGAGGNRHRPVRLDGSRAAGCHGALAVNAGDRLRVTVLGPEELTLEFGADDLPGPPVGGDLSTSTLRTGTPTPRVRPVAPNPGERAAGLDRFEVAIDGWLFQVVVEPAERAALRERARRGAGATRVHERVQVRAQIPGRVVRLWVEPGQAIEKGHRMLAIEAMKMENEVRAPRSGTVETIVVTVGGTVELGDALVTLG